MADMKIFENTQFGSIRMMVECGKPLFCGNDVARALGYSVPKDAIRAHCKGAAKRRLPTNGGEQTVTFIPESDVYRLAFQSKLPGAERFTDWVTEEVLPSIRSTGSYAAAALREPEEVDAGALIQASPDDNSLSGIVTAAVKSTLSEVMPFVRPPRRRSGERKETVEGGFIGLRIDLDTLERFDRVCAAKMQTRSDLVKEGIRRMILENEGV